MPWAYLSGDIHTAAQPLDLRTTALSLQWRSVYGQVRHMFMAPRCCPQKGSCVPKSHPRAGTYLDRLPEKELCLDERLE